MSGDERREFTYTGARGDTVIDYVLGEERGRERAVRLEVEDKVDSDHHPLTVWVRGVNERTGREWRGCWGKKEEIEVRTGKGGG